MSQVPGGENKFVFELRASGAGGGGANIGKEPYRGGGVNVIPAGANASVFGSTGGIPAFQPDWGTSVFPQAGGASLRRGNMGMGPGGSPFGSMFGSMVAPGMSPIAAAMEQQRRAEVLANQGKFALSGVSAFNPNGAGIFGGMATGGSSAGTWSLSGAGLQTMTGMDFDPTKAAEAAKSSAARSAMGPMGKMGLRNIVYGTIWGLVADVMATGGGAFAQGGAMMSLAGGRPTAEARAAVYGPMHALSAVPIIGGALQGLYGIAGGYQQQANVELAETNIYSNTRYGVSGQRRLSQLGAVRAGSASFGQILADQQIAVQSIKNDVQKNQATLDQWKRENPAPVPYSDRTKMGRAWISIKGIFGGDQEQYSQQASANWENRYGAMRNEMGAATSASLAQAEAQGMEAKREWYRGWGEEQTSAMTGTLPMRFRPGFAAATRARELQRVWLGNLAPNLSRQDIGRMKSQEITRENELEGQRYDILMNVRMGSARGYNPYTYSPVAWQERTKETQGQAYSELTKALTDLKNTFAQFLQQHP